MDKLYSKQLLAVKAVGCVLLSPLFVFISSVLTIEDAFINIVASVIPVGCLYTIPFWASFSYIKKYRTDKIVRYIIYDAVFCLIPAVLGVLFTEIVYTVIYQTTFIAGILTVILTIIFILISLIFWALYFMFSRVK